MRHVTALLCVAGCLAAVPIWPAAAGPHHEHRAPHGGTLIVFGDEFAHLEVVLDSATGAVRAFVLDGEAERGVAVGQRALAIEVAPTRGDPFGVGLTAVDNVLTGEVVGNTSEFAGRSDRLVGLEHFEGTIQRLDVKGASFRSVRFRFPDGNEEAHAPASGEEQGHGPSEDREP
jgi:hypothetical protein